MTKIEKLTTENAELRKQNRDLLNALAAVRPGSDLISQRQATLLFGLTWLKEKIRDADRRGVRLWVRTGASCNSPKKYSASRLNSIMEWERVNGLPYDFGNFN